jgi:WD40 repeat protein
VIIGTARNDSAQPAVNVSVLYDLRHGTIQSLNEHTDTVCASDFSIDGQFIITASYDLNIIVWFVFVFCV